jgi:hypothetical protein
MRLLRHLGILGSLTLLLMVGTGTLVLVPPTHADTGPKPSADFEFEYEIDRARIVEGQLLECEDARTRTGCAFSAGS